MSLLEFAETFFLLTGSVAFLLFIILTVIVANAMLNTMRAIKESALQIKQKSEALLELGIRMKRIFRIFFGIFKKPRY